MSNQELEQLAEAGQHIYDSRLRSELESAHLQEFVAIEPMSGDYFLGQTLTDAMNAARGRHPQRRAFAIRIGQKCAIEIGGMSR